MNKDLRKKIINIFIILIYAAFTFVIMLYHEPWRDEAQAWLLAEDLSFNTILKFSQYEGHPMLWHLILMPFAKLGFPYITLNIISWLFMVMSAILIIYKSPFDTFVKICILLSSPFIYFYTSIARVYSLIAFLIILLAIIYNKKEKMPCIYGVLILLLANTHITMLGMVGILILDFYIKEIILNIKQKTLKNNIKLLIGFGIAVLGVLLVVVQLFGCISINQEVAITEKNKYLINLSDYFKTLIETYIGTCSESIYSILKLFIALIVLFHIYNLKKHTNSIMVFYASIIFQILIYVFVYQYTQQNILTIYFIILFCCWIEHYKKNNFNWLKILDITIVIISLITFLYSYKAINIEIKYNYSCAKETAKFINNHIDKNSIIISAEDITASSLVPYCKEYLFFSPQRKEFFKYVIWDEKRKTHINCDEFKSIINDLKKTNKIYVLSSNKYLPGLIKQLEDEEILTEIYSSNVSLMSDEIYFLYKVN